jgi:iron complex outermembrane receptor protein
VLSRRIWKDISLNLDFSHYEIKDYIVSADTGSDYYKKSPWGRRELALEKVHLDGIELELNGHIVDNIEFYLSYSYNDWKYKGPHNGGPEEIADERMSDRAKNRVNAGLRYNVFENTLLLLDYKYQDEQVNEIVDVIDEEAGEWEVREVQIDSYHLFDFAVEQTLFEEWRYFNDVVLKFYVNNLFDEEYQTSRGYPATDRTFGVSLSFGF